MAQLHTDWRDAGWETAFEPGKLLAFHAEGLREIDPGSPHRAGYFNLDAPLAIVSVELDGHVEGFVTFDVERRRQWSWASVAADAQARVQRVSAALGKRPRGMSMDYTVDYNIDYAPNQGDDQAFCVSLGDSWGPSSLTGAEALHLGLWSVARELAGHGAAFVKLPEEIARLILLEENKQDGFLDPEPLAKNARSLFLPYLEALSLHSHLGDEPPSRSRPSL